MNLHFDCCTQLEEDSASDSHFLQIQNQIAQTRLSPFCRAARCTGNYDLRLTIGRNARAFPPLPTISRTNAKLDLVHRSDHYWAADMFPTFSWSRSRASWSPTAFMSVLCSADVTYMCMSRNLGEGLMVRDILFSSLSTCSLLPRARLARSRAAREA